MALDDRRVSPVERRLQRLCWDR